MKKLISIGLLMALAGGFVLAENKRAEAMDPASAALIGASIFLLPMLGHMSYEHDHYRSAPYYSGANYDNPYPAQARAYYDYPYPPQSRVYYDYPYPVQTRVYYSTPRYERYYGRNWNRGYGYERDLRSHRGRFEDRRVRDYDRDRYAGRHYRDRY